MNPKVIVLCTVSTGIDAVAELLRNGLSIEAIVGVDPQNANPEVISGYLDIAAFAAKWNVRHAYVERYDLKSEQDKRILSALTFDLIWVVGWQRLIPDWLINLAPLGALGGHGSPDGIQGGRGRSPQNWAIMLGCRRFDLALFRITTGVDDGPIVAQRSFFYNETDDISISYKKAAICSGQMMLEILRNPELLQKATSQAGEAFYYPQRKPEDGYVDWNLTCRAIWAHCRALTRPYPGMRSDTGSGHYLTIWSCIPFDDEVNTAPGTVSFVFEDGCFLVQAMDGRIMISDYECSQQNFLPCVGERLSGKPYTDIIGQIVNRHNSRYPAMTIAKRITALIG
jgi:UDP-4-amino-4-deoxy-L-arabinose formyltransferase/UDP-glucuronic acid dehydrogenase (UDP-4-keto-hexauronic acid decarboxylating)